MLISLFLMIIISTSLIVPTQPSPRFHVEAWLPFRNREMDYWRLRGVLDPLSIANETLVLIHDIVAAQGSPFLVDIIIIIIIMIIIIIIIIAMKNNDNNNSDLRLFKSLVWLFIHTEIKNNKYMLKTNMIKIKYCCNKLRLIIFK